MGEEEEQFFEIYLEDLKDEDYFKRYHAAKSIGYLRNKKAINPLIQALEDQHPLVREYAAKSLGIIGDERAFEPLIKLMQDKHKKVKMGAINGLGVLGDKRAVKYLVEILEEYDRLVWSYLDTENFYHNVSVSLNNDDTDYIRIEVVRALGKLRDMDAVEILIGLLEDDDWFSKEELVEIGEVAHRIRIRRELRREVANALGEIRDKQALEPLISFLKEEMQYSFVEAIEEQPYYEFISSLDEKRTKEIIQIYNEGSDVNHYSKELGEPVNHKQDFLRKHEVRNTSANLNQIAEEVKKQRERRGLKITQENIDNGKIVINAISLVLLCNDPLVTEGEKELLRKAYKKQQK